MKIDLFDNTDLNIYITDLEAMDVIHADYSQIADILPRSLLVVPEEQNIYLFEDNETPLHKFTDLVYYEKDFVNGSDKYDAGYILRQKMYFNTKRRSLYFSDIDGNTMVDIAMFEDFTKAASVTELKIGIFDETEQVNIEKVKLGINYAYTQFNITSLLDGENNNGILSVNNFNRFNINYKSNVSNKLTDITLVDISPNYGLFGSTLSEFMNIGLGSISTSTSAAVPGSVYSVFKSTYETEVAGDITMLEFMQTAINTCSRSGEYYEFLRAVRDSNIVIRNVNNKLIPMYEVPGATMNNNKLQKFMRASKEGSSTNDMIDILFFLMMKIWMLENKSLKIDGNLTLDEMIDVYCYAR